jgi:hypothetical protein
MLGKKTLIGSKCILFHLDFVYYFYYHTDIKHEYVILSISLLLMTSLSFCWYFINLRNIIVLVTDELQDDIYLEWFTSEVKMMFPDNNVISTNKMIIMS